MSLAPVRVSRSARTRGLGDTAGAHPAEKRQTNELPSTKAPSESARSYGTNPIACRQPAARTSGILPRHTRQGLARRKKLAWQYDLRTTGLLRPPTSRVPRPRATSLADGTQVHAGHQEPRE